MPRGLFFLLLTAVLVGSAASQEASICLKGGGAMYFGDIDDQQITPYSGMAVDLWITRKFGVTVLGYYADLKAEKDIRYFESEVTAGAGLLKLRPFEKAVVSPYLQGGAQYYHINPVNKSGDPLPNNAAKVYSRNRFGLPAGGGISIFPSEKISFDLEALYHFTLTDYLDDLQTGDKKDGYYTASLGISLHFGKPKDTDGDGIVDKQDADPLHPEDFDGYRDFDGAPDPDNDNDGVPDITDKAPMAAEDRDGFEDEDGAPDLDNDQDGIPDEKDKAPNEAEDKDNFQDEDGVPDLDNDGDGIPDRNDLCPGTDQTVAEGKDTKETYNGFDDADGCPDKKPEIAVEKGQSIILEGVYFNTGSAALNPNSMFILDKVVRTLQDNPGIEVEIRGYTDNTGSYQRNIQLSKDRAEAVKIYLMNKGIDARKIRTHGFGPEDPVAPNNTREGRARNRRIEFFRVK
jgi:outer membrane protein OmpA-like peptidoglycan-associated protein